ncbi:MAG: class I SAM-dependent methyltransferase, partial [Candidatus Lokiarchaeia archaeon]
TRKSQYFKNEWAKRLQDVRKHRKLKISHIIDSKEIIEISSPLDGKILLDAGCGLGLSTIKLLKKNTKIIFLDIITESLMFIKQLIEIEKIKGEFILIAADIANLPLNEKSVNIIWSGGVLEHFHSLKKPYSELYRVLKKKGDLIFTIPNKFGLQRIISYIKEKILGSLEGHYEKGFIYYQLKNFFPNSYFSDYKIKTSGIIQTFYDILIPKLKIKLPYISFLFYKNIIIFLSKLIPSIKFSISWFRLYGKKK